jgi:hypothetical protein
MKNFVKIAVATFTAVALGFGISQVAAQARYDFAGSYSVAGVNPDGSKYQLNAVVTDYGDGYRVAYDDGGTGIATDVGDTIAIASQERGIPTVSVLKIINARQVSGFWQSYNGKVEGKEAWTEQ